MKTSLICSFVLMNVIQTVCSIHDNPFALSPCQPEQELPRLHAILIMEGKRSALLFYQNQFSSVLPGSRLGDYRVITIQSTSISLEKEGIAFHVDV